MPDFVRAQKLLGYSFSDVSLLERALTHTSYANEHSERGHWDSNQRLEFLGDSVLGLVISTYMYANYPGMAEGELSRFRSNIVCEETLYEVASVFCLGEFMLFGRGEILTGGSRKISVLADCVESVIAAVYLDSGFESARRFVLDNLGFRKRIDSAGSCFAFSDHKSALQEFFHDPAVQIHVENTNRFFQFQGAAAYIFVFRGPEGKDFIGTDRFRRFIDPLFAQIYPAFHDRGLGSFPCFTELLLNKCDVRPSFVSQRLPLLSASVLFDRPWLRHPVRHLPSAVHDTRAGYRYRQHRNSEPEPASTVPGIRA